ncbi:MAG: TIR domain-containing protein [Anaerolineales bacterium]|nr:TIR domain-containing protein [Anaerolineales bacterium]
MAEPPQNPRRKSKMSEDNPSVLDYGGTSESAPPPEYSQTAEYSQSAPPASSTDAPEPAPAQDVVVSRIYLSYSRRDKAFAEKLHGRLTADGFDVWVDWEDIQAGTEWKGELQMGLQTSNVVIFVVSPASLQSTYMMMEFRSAQEQGKYIIPIVGTSGNIGEAPSELTSIQWLRMGTPEEFEQNFPVLVKALTNRIRMSGGPTIPLDFAHNDRPTGKDQLDYQSYARAFAQVLASPHTKPPLTIGLYASWGMGKSFLMNKIKEELRAKEHHSKQKDQTEMVFHFIDFNAWEYSTSDNLWAGLITSLYGQVEKAYKPWQIYRFRWTKRFRKNLRKTFGWGTLFALLGLTLAFLLDENTAGQVTGLMDNLKNLFGTAFLSGTTLAALIAFLRSARDLLDSTAPRSKELQATVSRKDFSAQIGFMDEIKGEIGEMLTLIQNIEKGKRDIRFVLFVDDLDRCPPAKAVEVLEALLLLLSYQEGEAPFFIFLAIDARVIVKAIEEHYGKMLTEAGISGYEFLDKVVQIPFRIPPAGPGAMKKYMTSLLWQSEEARTEAEDRAVRARLAADLAANNAPTPPSTPVQTLPDQPPESLPEFIPEEPFNENEQTAFDTFAPFITPNPRRMKRIVNIYRIVRYLFTTGGIVGIAIEDPPLRAIIIKWIIITEEWPFRAAWMLQKIEDDYQLGIGLYHTAEATLPEIYQVIKPHIQDERAKNLLALDSDPETFEMFITLEPAITVQMIYHALRPITFNLNPAMRSEVLRTAAVNNVKSVSK